MKPKTLVTTCLVSIALSATIVQAAEIRTVALSGQQAPAMPDGVSFLVTNFGSGFSAPVLNDVGQTAFRAQITGIGVDGTNSGGLWSEGSGSLAIVARGGDHAPGTPSGVNFSDFSGFSLVLNDAGQIAFSAYLAGSGVDAANDHGIWSEGSGSLALVARNGDHAPGPPSGVNYRSFDFRPVMNNAGQTAFLAFASNGVDLGGSGIWSEGSGSLALVAGHGSQAAGTPSGVNYRFTSNSERPVLNDAGQTAFSALLTGSGVSGSNDEGIWSEGFGSLALVAREGDHAPGTPDGVNFSGLTQFRSPVLNNAGQTAFGARLTDGGRGIWSEGSGSLALVALSGQQAPGMPSGENFAFSNSSPSNPVLNDTGQTAFWAYTSNGNGIWLEDSGSLALVVRAGNHAPGTPNGVSFSSFIDTPVLNNAGQIAFTNYLTGSGVDGANDKGIWATDRSGALQLIVREGDLLEVAPGDFRTIKDFMNSNGSSPDFDFTGNTGNGDGRPSAFNNLGQLAFAARFTDGSSGIFVSNRVAIPEPSTLAFAAAGLFGVAIARRRRAT